MPEETRVLTVDKILLFTLTDEAKQSRLGPFKKRGLEDVELATYLQDDGSLTIGLYGEHPDDEDQKLFRALSHIQARHWVLWAPSAADLAAFGLPEVEVVIPPLTD